MTQLPDCLWVLAESSWKTAKQFSPEVDKLRILNECFICIFSLSSFLQNLLEEFSFRSSYFSVHLYERSKKRKNKKKARGQMVGQREAEVDTKTKICFEEIIGVLVWADGGREVRRCERQGGMKEEEDTSVSPNKLTPCCKSSYMFIILSNFPPALHPFPLRPVSPFSRQSSVQQISLLCHQLCPQLNSQTFWLIYSFLSITHMNILSV